MGHSSLQFKWNVLFDKPAHTVFAFKPELGLQVYPCYSCREIFGSRNSFLDHVNRRGIVLKYKCEQCDMSLMFYNPCSLLLHLRQHYTPMFGTINLDNLEISSIPFGMAGFLPHPGVTVLFNVQDDEAPPQMNINTRFYSPALGSLGKKIISLIADELMFLYNLQDATAPTPTTITMVLKQISTNIPRCKFVLMDAGNVVPNHQLLQAAPRHASLIVTTANNLNMNNNIGNSHQTGVQHQDHEVDMNLVKTEPITIEENDVNSMSPVITKVESLAEDDYSGDESGTTSMTKEKQCSECGKRLGQIDLTYHFVQRNRPNDEHLNCGFCGYIAATKCSLAAHERIHQSKAPHVCPECGKKFKDSEELNAHMSDVCFHMSKQVRFRCTVTKCGKIFAQTQTFSMHLLQHIVSVSSCPLCSRTFENEHEFMNHVRAEHGISKGKNILRDSKCFLCRLCNNFRTFQDCTAHMNAHVRNKNNCAYVYVCKDCKGCYRSAQTYETHLFKCRQNRKAKSPPAVQAAGGGGPPPPPPRF